MDNSFTPADKRWFKEFVANFSEVTLKSDTSALMRCEDPYKRHNNKDQNPSLTADMVPNGSGPTILFHCQSQECDIGAILESINKTTADLYPNSKNDKNQPIPDALPGCTIEAYAAAKRLPVDFLKHEFVGLKDSTYFCKVSDKKIPAIWTPYMDESGALVAVRYRTGLHKPAKGDDTRFRWAKGANLTLYGRNWLDITRETGYVLLVEGESDCHVGWYHNIPTIGIPGANNWKDEWAKYLDDIPKLKVAVEPDAAGAGLWEKVSSCSRLRGRLGKVVLP